MDPDGSGIPADPAGFRIKEIYGTESISKPIRNAAAKRKSPVERSAEFRERSVSAAEYADAGQYALSTAGTGGL